MRRFALAGAVILALLAAGPLRAAEIDVLKAIPADALGFVLINRLDKTSEKLAKVGQLAQAPIPPGVPLLMLLKMQIGIQAGVDDTGSAAVAVMPPGKANGEPIPLILVPVTDYKQFLDQLGPENETGGVAKVKLFGNAWLVVNKGQFAVLCEDKENDQAPVVARFLHATTNVTSAIKPLIKRLLANDIAVALTPDGVARVFDQVEQGLAQAKGAAPLAGPQSEVIGAVTDLGTEIFQNFRREVSHFAAGLHVDDEGNIDLGTWSIFVPAGEYTRSAREATAPEGNVLGGLPQGSYLFAIGGVVPPSWSKGLADILVKLMKANPGLSEMTAEQSEKMTELMISSMKGVDSVTMSMGASKPGESLYAHTLAVVRVHDAAAYLANQKKSTEMIAQLSVGGSKTYEFKELKIAGCDALEVTADMVALTKANGEQDAAAKKALEQITGPGGKLTTYLAAVDSKTVAMTYVDAKNIERLAACIKSKKDALLDDADFAVTTGLLPAGGQWAGCLSPAGFVDFIRSNMEQAGPAMPFKLTFPAYPKTPPIGATAKMLSVGLETHLVVPAPVLTATGKFVQEFQAAQVQNIQIQIQAGGGAPPGLPPAQPPAIPKRPAK